MHIHGSNGASVGVETDRGATFIAGMSEIAEPPLNDLWTIPGEEDALAEFQAEDRARFRQIDADYTLPSPPDPGLPPRDHRDRPPLVTGEDGRRVVALFRPSTAPSATAARSRCRSGRGKPRERAGRAAASSPGERPAPRSAADGSFVPPLPRRRRSTGARGGQRRLPCLSPGAGCGSSTRLDPVAVQERTLLGLVRKRAATRFGRDHGFADDPSVADFQTRVPLRTYEDLWEDYLKDQYPVFDNLTWPGKIPYLALTSGTTQGATKYIPVSRAMIASNRKAAQTMVACHLARRPESRLFQGRIFFLGGSTDLEQPAPGRRARAT